MIRRRSTPDPLTEFRHLRHWLTVADALGKLLESQALEAGTDLRAVLNATMDRLRAEGWGIEGDGRYGSFYANRNGVRQFVHLRPTDPQGQELGCGYFPQTGFIR